MSKVIFHVDEPDRWPLALINAGNLIQYGRTENIPFQVEILANSRAVARLTPEGAAGLRPQMEALSQSGVRFAGCRIAMENLKIGGGDLLPFAETVPSGVVELVFRQEEGYSYIRP